MDEESKIEKLALSIAGKVSDTLSDIFMGKKGKAKKEADEAAANLAAQAKVNLATDVKDLNLDQLKDILSKMDDGDATIYLTVDDGNVTWGSVSTWQALKLAEEKKTSDAIAEKDKELEGVKAELAAEKAKTEAANEIVAKLSKEGKSTQPVIAPVEGAAVKLTKAQILRKRLDE